LNATVIVPSFLKDKLTGIFILGDKRSGRIYTSEDLDTFSVLASQTALAVENASLYENMEEQVKEKTKELVEIQKQLIQAEKLATVGTLAGGVAHEINNPLAAILTNTQMLLVSSKDADDRESLQLIEEATKRCRDIVKKLMIYSRKPLGRREVKEIDLKKALGNVISFVGYQLMQDNIRVNMQLEKGSYIIKGSQNEIEQVFTNLILNSRDAIKKINRRGGNIEISMYREGKMITIKVKDDGTGISKEDLPKIFDPFFTTKEVGKGTGLGLSICQSIVESYDGKITVESELNKGSTFTIYFLQAKN
jgi:C4-dicarboxylate-specific signal transduction histidine kinase